MFQPKWRAMASCGALVWASTACEPVFDPLAAPSQAPQPAPSSPTPGGTPSGQVTDSQPSASPPTSNSETDLSDSGAVGRCERGIVSDDRRYLYCPILVSFDVAEQECERRSMQLAKISSAQAEAQMVELTRGFMHSFWAGGRREDGLWYWRDGQAFGAPDAGVPFDGSTRYQNWEEGEPNNDGGEHCLEVNIHPELNWNDTECFNRRSFMCEG